MEFDQGKLELSEFHSNIDEVSGKIGAFGGAVCTILGSILNVLTIYTISKSKSLKKNPIAPLICALAFSDLTFCLVLILVSIQSYHNEPFEDGSFWCNFSPIFYRLVFQN